MNWEVILRLGMPRLEDGFGFALEMGMALETVDFELVQLDRSTESDEGQEERDEACAVFSAMLSS